MSPVLVAIDVGGSTSRASVIDLSGRCLGQGRNRGGNPASNTPERSAEAIIAAVEAALAETADRPDEIALVLIALAGPRSHVARDRLEQAFRAMGLTGPLVFTGDLNAMLASVTASPDGYCIVAGTGAGAVRFRNGEIEAMVDAAGWLVGDFGSGYWLGHQAAIAVCAALDGRGPETGLTGAVLGALDIHETDGRAFDSRPTALRQFIDRIYALRPIELARFAPLVIAHRADPVAADLLSRAEGYLVDDFRRIFSPDLPGPVALGGGIIGHLDGLQAAIGAIVAAAGQVPDIRPVQDGSIGAAVLALRAHGAVVDEAMIRTLAASLRGAGAATP